MRRQHATHAGLLGVDRADLCRLSLVASEVTRGRYGIGVQLGDGRCAQADEYFHLCIRVAEGLVETLGGLRGREQAEAQRRSQGHSQ